MCKKLCFPPHPPRATSTSTVLTGPLLQSQLTTDFMWSLQFFSSSVKQDYEDKHGPAPRELITGAEEAWSYR